MNQIFGQDKQTKQNYLNNGYPNNQQLNNNYYYGNNYRSIDYEEENNKRRKIYNNNLSKIILFFCIFNIIYGLALIGSGVWGIQLNKPKEADIPYVTLDKVGSRVTIHISTEFPIQYASYTWNSGAETEIPTTGLTEVTTIIKVIEGNNILHINVKDKYDNVYHYQRQYIRNSQDNVDPVITVSTEGADITITATDDQKIAYISYRWGEEEETIIRANEELGNTDGKVLTTTIPARRGANTLVINAQDAEENMAKTYTYEIRAAEKPKLELAYENGFLIIHAKDDIGLNTLKIVLDGETVYSQEIENTPPEFDAQLPLSSGTHEISISITNLNGYETAQSGTFQI